MKLLSKAGYDRRLSELTAEQAAAETDYRRAALALELESGDEASVEKARAHVERVTGRISGLHSAWAESQRLSKEQCETDRAESYAEFVSAIESQAKARGKAIDAVRVAATKLAEAMVAFDATTPAIRALSHGYARNDDSRRIPDYLDHQLDICAVAGAVLRANGAKSMPYGTDRDFEELRDRESRFAEGLFNHVGMMKPAPAPAAPMGLLSEKSAKPDDLTPPPGMHLIHSPNAGPASGWAAEQEGA